MKKLITLGFFIICFVFAHSVGAGADTIVDGDLSDTIGNEEGLIVVYVEYPTDSIFYGNPFPEELLPREIEVYFANGEFEVLETYSYLNANEGYEYTLETDYSHVISVEAVVETDWPGDIVVSTAPGNQVFYDKLPILYDRIWLYHFYRTPKDGEKFDWDRIASRY
jgi:hypothetical protein